VVVGLATDGLTRRAWLISSPCATRSKLTARLDHREINAVPPFDRDSPTTERIARWFFEEYRGVADGAARGGEAVRGTRLQRHLPPATEDRP
jgi:hypothetical protein